MRLLWKRTVLVAAVVYAASASQVSAGVIINFTELPNEGGIVLSGSDISGSPFSVTKPNAETFHLSSPVVPAGYPADATLSHIGISHVTSGYLVNILESPGGPISDQVHVYQYINIFTVIDFISDPDQFVVGTPDITVVETGDLQPVLTYFNDRGEGVDISIQSDVESAVPEPATVTMLGMGVASMFGYGWRRRKAAVA